MTKPTLNPPTAEDFLSRMGGAIRDAVKADLLPRDTHKVTATLKKTQNGQLYWEVKSVEKPTDPIVGECKLFSPLPLSGVEAAKLARKLCPEGITGMTFTNPETGEGVHVSADDAAQIKKAA